MANIISIQVSPPPDNIKVLVDFYDDTNRDLLLTSPAASELTKTKIPQKLEVPTVDLLTYYLFYKKRPGTIGYTNYHEITSKYKQALVEIDGLINFKNDSLCAKTKNINSGTTERLGEAIGLSVISKIHGLIDADWSKISETPKKKTLDYEYAASNGHLIIKTETKGSICHDNRLKSSSVSQHKASIKAKKIAERKSSSNAMLYGTIAVLDDRANSVARCYILDPTIIEESSPERFRIVARLTAIAELISFISYRSQVSASLRTRLESLKALDDIQTLNNIPLLRGDGDKFSTDVYNTTWHHNPWFRGKTRVEDGPAGGQVFQVDERNLLFLGIREDLLIYAIEQSFETILFYKFPAGTVYKRVLCSVPKGRFKTEFTSVQKSNVEIKKSGGYVHFTLGGYLHYSNGGMVFGILPIPEGEYISGVNGLPSEANQ